MKNLFQYVYYRIAKAYKDIFGIKDAPGYPSSGGFVIRQYRISAFAMREKGLLNWMKNIIFATET
jgi:hypothetical protein